MQAISLIIIVFVTDSVPYFLLAALSILDN